MSPVQPRCVHLSHTHHDLDSSCPHHVLRGIKQGIRIRRQWRLYGRSQHSQSKLLTLCSHQLRSSSNFIPLRSEISYHVMSDSLNWLQEKTGVSHVQPGYVHLTHTHHDLDSPCSHYLLCGIKQRMTIRNQWRLYGRSQQSVQTRDLVLKSIAYKLKLHSASFSDPVPRHVTLTELASRGNTCVPCSARMRSPHPHSSRP